MEPGLRRRLRRNTNLSRGRRVRPSSNVPGAECNLTSSRYRLSVVLCALALLAAATAAAGQHRAAAGGPSAAAPTYSKDVRPILQAHCTVCHSAATASNTAVSGGLALDSYAAIKAGTGQKADPVLTPGKSGASALYARLAATSPTRLMPKGGPPLPAAQIALIKRWIDAGAPAGGAVNAAAAAPTPESLPMPANRAEMEIAVPIKAALPAGLLEKGAPAQLALRIGPLPPVTALAYSPDGKRLAIGGYRAVAIWDTTTGRPVTNITHLPGAALALA